jgi:hypothetical protein
VRRKRLFFDSNFFQNRNKFALQGTVMFGGATPNPRSNMVGNIFYGKINWHYKPPEWLHYGPILDPQQKNVNRPENTSKYSGKEGNDRKPGSD